MFPAATTYSPPLIRYMKRRCTFLDNLPAFNYNTGGGEIMEGEGGKQITDTHNLGSTLMDTMLEEVGNFCNPAIMKNWAKETHQQVSMGKSCL